jgi:CelD/BcsL family acetyltransferase involved in cellulose biosynthesis
VLLVREPGGGPLALGIFSEGDGGKALRLLGAEDVYDYRDLVILAGEEERAMAGLVRFWAEAPWTQVELSGVSEFSPTLRLLPGLLRSGGFRVTETVEEVALYLSLPPTWDGFLDQLGSKDRHELRRKMRRLEREGSFEFTDPEGAALAHAVNAFLDLHRKSSSDKTGFMTPQMEDYFREISARFQELGWLHLPLLKVEGKEIAAFFSFRCRDGEYVFNSGYDPEYGRLSPGIVLAGHCIRQAIDGGVKLFHFLRGQEDYKYRLGGKEERIYQIRAVKR